MNDDTVKHGYVRVLNVPEIVASDGEAVVLELDRAIHELRRLATEDGRRLDWSSFRLNFENHDGELLDGMRILRVRILSEGVESES